MEFRLKLALKWQLRNYTLNFACIDMVSETHETVIVIRMKSFLFSLSMPHQSTRWWELSLDNLKRNVLPQPLSEIKYVD